MVSASFGTQNTVVSMCVCVCVCVCVLVFAVRHGPCEKTVGFSQVQPHLLTLLLLHQGPPDLDPLQTVLGC